MPGTSTPRCSSGVKWPAEGADGGERQQRQADEHVGAVQPGQPVEDRALRVVLRREADVDVLVDLDEQERRAEQEGGEDARPAGRSGCRAWPLERPVHVSDDESRIAVLTPAISFGRSVAFRRPLRAPHDPDEEVGREEGPEDHHLADDEQQHARAAAARPAKSGWPRAARGAPRGRRAAMRGGFHRRPPRPRARTRSRTRCARPACWSRPAIRSTSLSAIHSELPAGSVEIDDLGDVEVLHRVHGRPCRGRGRRSSRRRRSRPRAGTPAAAAAAPGPARRRRRGRRPAGRPR